MDHAPLQYDMNPVYGTKSGHRSEKTIFPNRLVFIWTTAA